MNAKPEDTMRIVDAKMNQTRRNQARLPARWTLATLLISSTLLLGCTDQAAQTEAPAEEDKAHLLQAQEDAMDRARAVEGQLQDAADQRLEDADEQGDG